MSVSEGFPGEDGGYIAVVLLNRIVSLDFSRESCAHHLRYNASIIVIAPKVDRESYAAPPPCAGVSSRCYHSEHECAMCREHYMYLSVESAMSFIRVRLAYTSSNEKVLVFPN